MRQDHDALVSSYRDRFFAVVLGIAAHLGRMPEQLELAQWIGERIDGTPLDQTTISKWLRKDGPTPGKEKVLGVVAMAAEYGIVVDPGWLMFGELSRAPALELPAQQLRVEEAASARRHAAGGRKRPRR